MVTCGLVCVISLINCFLIYYALFKNIIPESRAINNHADWNPFSQTLDYATKSTFHTVVVTRANICRSCFARQFFRCHSWWNFLIDVEICKKERKRVTYNRWHKRERITMSDTENCDHWSLSWGVCDRSETWTYGHETKVMILFV